MVTSAENSVMIEPAAGLAKGLSASDTQVSGFVTQLDLSLQVLLLYPNAPRISVSYVNASLTFE